MRLSIALHKRRAYPPGHPTLEAAVDAVLERAHPLLQAHAPSLTVGFARGWLSVDGEQREVRNAVVRELTERLHRRRIAAIRLDAGLDESDMNALLVALDAPPDAPMELNRPRVAIVRHDFRALELGATSADEAGERRWLALVEAVIAGGEPGGDGDVESPEGLAGVLRRRRGDGAFLRALSRRIATADAADDPRVRQLIAALDPDTLRALAAAAAAEGVAPDALRALEDADGVLAWVETAAAANGQTLSHFLLRLLRKLATLPVRSRLEAGPDDVREVASQLVAGWTLDNPNPTVHTALLERIAARGESQRPQRTAPLEEKRLLHMALELRLDGPALELPARALAERGALPLLVSTLEAISDDETHPGRAVLAAVLSEPETLRAALLEEPVNHDAARALLKRCDASAIPTLLDALTISESSATRQLIMERLRAFGAEATDGIIGRLDEAPWYVRRNLLVLLSELPEPPFGVPFASMMRDPEVAVRVEAIKLALRLPTVREVALGAALDDPDDRPVRLALEHALLNGVTPAVASRLPALLEDEKRAVDVRLRAVRLLPKWGADAARQWLLDRVSKRTRILRRVRLRSSDPEMLVALAALTRAWPQDPAVQEVLKLGRIDLRGAVRKAAGGEE